MLVMEQLVDKMLPLKMFKNKSDLLNSKNFKGRGAT